MCLNKHDNSENSNESNVEDDEWEGDHGYDDDHDNEDDSNIDRENNGDNGDNDNSDINYHNGNTLIYFDVIIGTCLPHGLWLSHWTYMIRSRVQDWPDIL